MCLLLAGTNLKATECHGTVEWFLFPSMFLYAWKLRWSRNKPRCSVLYQGSFLPWFLPCLIYPVPAEKVNFQICHLPTQQPSIISQFITVLILPTSIQEWLNIASLPLQLYTCLFLQLKYLKNWVTCWISNILHISHPCQSLCLKAFSHCNEKVVPTNDST
jgi:hypothetical protein